MVEKLFEKLFTDTQARERATKNGKNWASAAFGIGGGSCDDVAAWLEGHAPFVQSVECEV